MEKDIVLIEWIDSRGTERWEYLDEIEPMLPGECLSVGFIIEGNSDYTTIAMAVTDTQVLARMTIPAGCIKSMKSLGTSSGSNRDADRKCPHNR